MRPALIFIRILTLLATVPLVVWVMGGAILGRISGEVARNRLGVPTQKHPQKPIIWLHAASLGELSSVRSFVKRLCQRHPNAAILITTNNPKAQSVGTNWSDMDAIFQTAPLDLPFANKRFLGFWKPAAFINVESEIWPNRFAALRARKTPAIALNARLSNRSCRHYSFLGPHPIGLSLFDRIFTQDAQSAANFSALLGNAERVEPIPNIKSLVSLPEAEPALAALFKKTDTVLAASTHMGEDEIVLRSFSNILKSKPNLRLILAPRHPDRVDEISMLVEQNGLSVCLLSNPDSSTKVTIVDTLGELPKLYRLARVTFVGGSLLENIGGHTPYEPIRANTAIVTGPFTHNFETEYATLSNSKSCIIARPNTLDESLQTAFDKADQLAISASIALPVVSGDAIYDRAIDALGLNQ